MSRHGIFTHSGFHPDLSKFIAGLTNTETGTSALQKFNEKKKKNPKHCKLSVIKHIDLPALRQKGYDQKKEYEKAE